MYIFIWPMYGKNFFYQYTAKIHFRIIPVFYSFSKNSYLLVVFSSAVIVFIEFAPMPDTSCSWSIPHYAKSGGSLGIS